MLAILCPGQGAQSPGFLRPWLALPSLREELAELSTRAYVDLAELGADDDADVVDTAVAQPLVVGAGIAVASLLGAPPSGCVVVGHSVGELTAAAISGIVPPAAAIDLARIRGRAMAKAAAATPAGMHAVLGGDAAPVLAAIERSGCWVANHNGAGQIVAAGTREALERLSASPPGGARMRPLPVAGAFHSPLMEPARAAVQAAVGATATARASTPVVCNRDGSLMDDGQAFLAQVAAQLTRAVRFDRCLETIRRLGVTATIEVAPSGVLTGLVRRALPGVQTVALRTPDDLADAYRLLDATAAQGAGWSEPWQLVTAPVNGTFARSGSVDLVVRTRDGDVPVATAHAEVVEWLAADGDPVTAGQPLVRVATT